MPWGAYLQDGNGATRRAVLAGASATALLGSSMGPTLAAPVLNGPVNVEQRRAIVGRPLASFGCPAPNSPVHDLDVQDPYTDPAFSIIDPEKERKMVEATRPLGAYSVKVAQLSDLWLLSQPARTEPAACALTWLDSWASADAMLGQFNSPGAHHQRRWTLGGLALAYLKIRNAPGLDAAAKRRVEQWFTKLSDADAPYYGKWSRQSYSNHIFWWALALTATGVATSDRAMFDHGVTIYRAALEDIQPDGTLPLEMARKGRALGYHIFALTPLVMIAEIGAANGLDLYAGQGGALHRLAQRVLDGLVDPDWFAARTGAQQEAKIDKFTFVWAEPYYARFPDPALGKQIAEHRPLFYAWLGGSTTYDFGSPAVPFLRS
jgi:poly(beta-D-mannuronate) lyase